MNRSRVENIERMGREGGGVKGLEVEFKSLLKNYPITMDGENKETSSICLNSIL